MYPGPRPMNAEMAQLIVMLKDGLVEVYVADDEGSDVAGDQTGPTLAKRSRYLPPSTASQAPPAP